MLKTSESIESTIRPRKGGLGMNSDGSDKDYDDGSGCNGDSNWKFASYNMSGPAILY